MRIFRRRFGKLRGLVAALPLLVGACTLVPDWADPTDFLTSDDAAAQGQKEGQLAGTDSFPKLSSVPDAAPRTTTVAAQDELRATLAADQAKAKLSAVESGTSANTAKMPLASVPTAPISVKTTDAAATPTKVQVPKSPQQTTPEPALAKPTKSAFRFTQFDKNLTAGPVTPAATRNSELVAVIYFAYGSTTLNRDDREVLRDVVALQKQRGGIVRVIGHASARTGIVDSVRHRLANFETSLQRANAVAAQLVRLGVAREKVAAEAKADSQPVFHEFMPTGEAGNRRAEIFLEN